MLVSVIIKALNEEARIAAAIESALSAVAALPNGDGEVIVVDSGSTDRTLEIASRYPILVVALANAGERCCGIGPQLGFQHARGAYVCLIDGDMELDASFLPGALAFLETHPKFAGVSALIEEMNLESLEFARRVKRAPVYLAAGEVDRLNGGGLFRRNAIAETGYFTDRNLHAHEEFELAARLRARGWRLQRLDQCFVRHYGHTLEAYRLLWRRWKSGYVLGIGEAVRAGLGRAHARAILGLPEVRLWMAVAASWAACLLALILAPSWPVGVALAAVILAFPVVVMSLRDRSLAMGLYAVVAWHVHTLGFIVGLLRPRVDPNACVAGLIVCDGRQRQRIEQAENVC